MLAYVLSLLNQRHSYGLDLVLLSVDEGISGYRDDSLETVKRNEQQYGIPLTIVSYQQLYGWSMDQIVKQIGTRNNCTFCGVFRRQALDRGAFLVKANKVATGVCLQPPTAFTWMPQLASSMDAMHAKQSEKTRQAHAWLTMAHTNCSCCMRGSYIASCKSPASPCNQHCHQQSGMPCYQSYEYECG